MLREGRGRRGRNHNRQRGIMYCLLSPNGAVHVESTVAASGINDRRTYRAPVGHLFRLHEYRAHK